MGLGWGAEVGIGEEERTLVGREEGRWVGLGWEGWEQGEVGRG